MNASAKQRKDSTPHKDFLARDQFQSLFDVLHRQNYKIIGPVIQDGAIVFAPVNNVSQLAFGVIDTQQPGSYKLIPSDNDRYFEWVCGPQALKPLLFKPHQPLWTCRADDQQLSFKQHSAEAEALAVIGVRACDLSALALQDKHFLHGNYVDAFYQEQREKMLLIAVNCSRSGEQCFCASTGDGPDISFYYDLRLDELEDGFLLDSGSESGQQVLQDLPLLPASSAQIEKAQHQIAQAAKQQTKQIPNNAELATLLKLNKSDDWKSVAEHCLACGSCTLVCPTCFCSKQETDTDLSTGQSSQVRIWDSCFSEEYGHIVGKNYRPEIAARYRQWMLHKLVIWREQYGRSGCVGCGRCTTWCPAAIDFVEQAKQLIAQVPSDTENGVNHE